jgi:phosphopantothenoylcysteine decarboxylase
MSRLVLGVTGSVAAIRTPAIVRELLDHGHEVRVVATEPALHFFDVSDFAREFESSARRLYRDRDEWPLTGYQTGAAVPHIEFRNWADLLVVAPLDANTLGKFALGLCDNFLTCLFRAWDFAAKPVILAPAMNTKMWDHPATRRHLATLLGDHASTAIPPEWTLAEADALFARLAPRIVLVPPQVKTLACGEVGNGAMAEVVTIAHSVRKLLSEPFPNSPES